jgi:formate hydrogenlyase transcriptional activator
MTSADLDGPATAADDRYRILLAVSAAIIAHGDLSALFQEMAGRLRQVVNFDHLVLVLHEAATNTMRVHLLEPAESITIDLPPEERPAGIVWQTQQPLITSRIADLQRWPRLLEHVQSYGVQSSCWPTLTTARHSRSRALFGGQ